MEYHGLKKNYKINNMDYKQYDLPLEYEYRKKEREMRKRNHLCIQCGQQDAYTLAGRSRCARCCEQAKPREHENYKKNGKESNRRRYEKYLREGRCVKCGGVIENGRKVCKTCCIKTSQNRIKRNISKNINWPRGDNGLCWQCNKEPVKKGFKVCENCYQKLIEYQKKAVQVCKETGVYEKHGKWISDFWKLKKIGEV